MCGQERAHRDRENSDERPVGPDGCDRVPARGGVPNGRRKGLTIVLMRDLAQGTMLHVGLRIRGLPGEAGEGRVSLFIAPAADPS